MTNPALPTHSEIPDGSFCGDCPHYREGIATGLCTYLNVVIEAREKQCGINE